jgi:hypothetical protein
MTAQIASSLLALFLAGAAALASTPARADQVLGTVAHVTGRGNQFRTDVKALNIRASVPVSGVMVFTPYGKAMSSADPKVPFVMNPGVVRVFSDISILAHPDLHDAPDLSYADHVTVVMDTDPNTGKKFPNAILQASVYTPVTVNGQLGRLSLSVPAFAPEEFGKVGIRFALISGNSHQRFNMQFISYNGPAQIQVTVREQDGSNPRNNTIDIAADTTVQYNDGEAPFGHLSPYSSIEYLVLSGNVIPTGTPIDGGLSADYPGSGNGYIRIARKLDGNTEDLIVPTTTFSTGYNATKYASDLIFYNPTDSTLTGRLRYTSLNTTENPGVDPERAYTIAPRNVLALEQLIWTLDQEVGKYLPSQRIRIIPDVTNNTTQSAPIAYTLTQLTKPGVPGATGVEPTVRRAKSDYYGKGATLLAIVGGEGTRTNAFLQSGEPDAFNHVVARYASADRNGGNRATQEWASNPQMTFQYNGSEDGSVTGWSNVTVEPGYDGVISILPETGSMAGSQTVADIVTGQAAWVDLVKK